MPTRIAGQRVYKTDEVKRFHTSASDAASPYPPCSCPFLSHHLLLGNSLNIHSWHRQ